jgi:hypothetical protein
MFFARHIEMKMFKIILLLFLFGIGTMNAHGTMSMFNPDDKNITVVFPNPATDGFVSIQTEKEIAQIEILNIVGQRIFLYRPESLNSVRLDISNLNAGIYILKLSFSDNTNDTKRIWVK